MNTPYDTTQRRCLAALHQAQERFAEAEDLYRQVLAIKATLFDADHVEIALTLHNLAVLYSAMARDDEAAELLRRALTIFTRTLHDAHPHVLVCREHLAELQCQRPD